MVLIEAMAGGLPVISVDDKAYKDVVIDGYNGFLVENTHEKFSNALLSILTNDEKRRQMSVNAQAFAKKFSAEKTAESLEKIY